MKKKQTKEKKSVKKIEKKDEVKKKPKPVWTEKRGNVQLSLFKNKNKQGIKYPIFVASIFRYPFKYNQKLCANEKEMENLEELIKSRPEIKRK